MILCSSSLIYWDISYVLWCERGLGPCLQRKVSAFQTYMWVCLLVPCTPPERGHPEVSWCRRDTCTICGAFPVDRSVKRHWAISFCRERRFTSESRVCLHFNPKFMPQIPKSQTDRDAEKWRNNGYWTGKTPWVHTVDFLFLSLVGPMGMYQDFPITLLGLLGGLLGTLSCLQNRIWTGRSVFLSQKEV